MTKKFLVISKETVSYQSVVWANNADEARRLVQDEAFEDHEEIDSSPMVVDSVEQIMGVTA